MNNKPPELSLFERIYSCHTISGVDIYKPETSEENLLASPLVLLSQHVGHLLEDSGIPEADLVKALAALQRALHDPFHFGDNRPGAVFNDGTPVTPDPQFNFSDLMSYGPSAWDDERDGYTIFRTRVGLPTSITMQVCMGLAALLLIDSAVNHLRRGAVFHAAGEALQAADWALEIHTGVVMASERKSQAQRGGKASGERLERYRREVLDEWDKGRFRGNKTEAARWLADKYPTVITNHEVVRRWIRNHVEKQ